VFRVVEFDEQCVVLYSDELNARKVYAFEEFGTDVFAREFEEVRAPEPQQGLDVRELVTVSSTLHRALGMVELGLATVFADDELFARFNALRSACLDLSDVVDARIRAQVEAAIPTVPK
jgi:hypothetical protein